MKTFGLLVTIVIFCLLAACSKNIPSANAAPTISPTETPKPTRASVKPVSLNTIPATGAEAVSISQKETEAQIARGGDISLLCGISFGEVDSSLFNTNGVRPIKLDKPAELYIRDDVGMRHYYIPKGYTIALHNGKLTFRAEGCGPYIQNLRLGPSISNGVVQDAANVGDLEIFSTP